MLRRSQRVIHNNYINVPEHSSIKAAAHQLVGEEAVDSQHPCPVLTFSFCVRLVYKSAFICSLEFPFIVISPD